MKIIVQKFGGTSVSTRERRQKAVEKIIKARSMGYSPVVVVSAMGRKGDPYATDTLLGLIDPELRESNRREVDLLISCGEVISSVVMVSELKSAGYEAVALTGPQAGIVTDGNFGDAGIVRINPERILELLAQDKIVVVTGFQGGTPSGDIATLGRGGSDTTATALGVALRAEIVEIYSDVDGVMSADPGVIPEARPLSILTYDEICEMAHNGAKVMHPRAVEIARDAGLPVKVRSTFSDSAGTLITSGRSGRVITGITQLGGLSRIEVIFPQGEDVDRSQIQVKVFKAISDAGINVDFINILEDGIYFTVRSDRERRALEAISRLGLEARALPGCAKVSVIGAGMQEVPGIMARVVEALHRSNIPIMHTVDSEITISCLINEADANRATRALFEEFQLASVS